MPKAMVLAGGGARGSYHIGAWQALIEMGYRPDIVTGTSVGSLNGTLVALDWFDVAKSMWLTIDDRNVMEVPHKLFSRETLEFAKDFATKGGISLEPLEEMITRFVDEDKLRASKCRYGLVTVNINTLTPMELTLEEIPRGKLVDYMLASSACFPLLRARTIDGQKYIDGGYHDNLPSTLAAKMGADEIVEIDLDSIGVTRPLPKEYENIKVTQVKSWHDLGGFLDFNPQTARRNIELGYLDTYKAFGKLEGKRYAFRTGETQRMYSLFGKRFVQLCHWLCETHSAMHIADEVFVRTQYHNPKTKEERFVALLEGAMEAADIPYTEVYTADNLPQLILSAPQLISDADMHRLLQDNPLSKVLSLVEASDIRKVYLALLQTLLKKTD
ncbi:MAG: patatin-like phospholipase family protein [Oscillospiraceae bacterium]|nr:patatin-like phospholipase family protein [Oscillospiraceae bacterium]